MPTKVQRLNITISQEQRALLFELAELEGVSVSSFVRGMIDKVTPMLRVAVPMLREAAKQSELAQAEADRIIGQVFREAVELEQLDLLDDAGSTGRATTNATQRAAASEAERRRSPVSSSED